MKCSTITLDECDKRIKIWEHLVDETEPKVYGIPLPSTEDTILLLNSNLRVKPLADLQIKGCDIEHLFKRRVPVGDLLDDGLNGNAVAEELELSEALLDLRNKTGEVIRFGMIRKAIRWYIWGVDQRSPSWKSGA